MGLKSKIIIVSILALVAAFGAYYFSGKPGKVTNYPSSGTDIIAFGDSLVAGVGSSKGNDFISRLSISLGEPIVNLGRSGDTTEDGLRRLKEMDRYAPKVVILLLGGNDYLRKIPLADTKKNLSLLIENIHARGAVVLLLGVRGGLLSDGFKGTFEEIRGRYGTAYVPDVLEGLFGNSKYMSDAIHPNDAGYMVIAERVYHVLKEVVK